MPATAMIQSRFAVLVLLYAASTENDDDTQDDSNTILTLGEDTTRLKQREKQGTKSAT